MSWKKFREAREETIQLFLQAGLPIRVAKRLAFNGFKSLEEVRLTSDEVLLDMRGFHKKSLTALRQVLPFAPSE